MKKNIIKETSKRIKEGINSNRISILCTLLVVVGMIFFSEFFGEKEIIFPEVTALAIGIFLAPKLSWKTNYRRIFILIGFCAISGVCIVRYLPVPIWTQFSIAYALSQIILLCSKTTFAPMISAIMLPVMLQTKTPVYICAAFILTATIILVRLVLEKKGVKEKNTYIPEKKDIQKEIILAIIRIGVVLLLSVVVFGMGYDLRFFVAPPLLVFFTEITKRDEKVIKDQETVSEDDKKKIKRQQWMRIKKGIPFITLCAFTGVFCRYTITVLLGLPLTLSAVIAISFMIVYLFTFEVFLPPAGAMTILAMLIPESMMLFYPVQVFFGVLILSIFGMGIKGKLGSVTF